MEQSCLLMAATQLTRINKRNDNPNQGHKKAAYHRFFMFNKTGYKYIFDVIIYLYD